ncbi:GSU3473 family protein [Trichlorobacter ammonificans]|uniref:Uncharacterized protein n=1 Tax=Trichlorobacter ammonificans TaxID=2916410 RepID=A0ABN8HEP5_9BACT|nr:hypothetical protein [Trichlorobacter ammonificans]CAH2031348.1 conserved protein of unknown function [Trichlorobacter ammonificans]
MLIRVRYTDNRYDMVRPEVLDRLLERGAVAEFKRRDGWVSGSAAAVRGTAGVPYAGPERRGASPAGDRPSDGRSR